MKSRWIDFSIGRWDVRAVFRPNFERWRFHCYRSETNLYFDFFFFTLDIEDGLVPAHLVCAECDKGLIQVVSAGDEYWSTCPICRSVEGNTRMVGNREAANYFGEQ